MKKITILLLLTIGIMVGCNTKSNAQIAMYRNTDTTSAGVATAATITSGTSDSLHDANTLYSFYTKVGALNNNAVANYLVTFNVTKLTGTGTARVYIQGSADGVTWRNLNLGIHGSNGLNCDTLAIAAATVAPGVGYAYYSTNGAAVYNPATNAATFWVNSGRCFYLRAKIVGAGTQLTVYSNFKVFTYN
jgi:hypothetical protein